MATPPKKIPGETDLAQVSMSNALARAAHRLTLSEKRIIALGLALTDQKIKLQENAGLRVRIHASQYAEKFEVDMHTAYDQLRSAGRRLYLREASSVWQVKDRFDDRVDFDFRWVSSAKYSKAGEGWIELNFSPEIAPHLVDLKDKFLTYKLKQTVALQSIYGWRLYEVLLSYVSQQKEKEFEFMEFAILMDAPNSCFRDFGAMRRVIIEPAVREINQKSDLTILEVEKDKNGNPVFFESIKKGKKVSGIKFYFKKTKAEAEPEEAPKGQPAQPEKAAKTPRTRKEETPDKAAFDKAIEDLLGMRNLAKMAGKPLAELATPQQMETYRKYKLPVD